MAQSPLRALAEFEMSDDQDALAAYAGEFSKIFDRHNEERARLADAIDKHRIEKDRIIQEESRIGPMMDGGPHRSAPSPEQLALYDEIGRHYAEGVNLEARRVRLDAITVELEIQQPLIPRASRGEIRYTVLQGKILFDN
jgi:hypothetical protein